MNLATMASVICCPLMCLAVIAFNCMETAEASRRDFQKMRMRHQTQWILDYLRTHSDKTTQSQIKFTFIVGTALVCLDAWRLILGVSENRLKDIIRNFKGNIMMY